MKGDGVGDCGGVAIRSVFMKTFKLNFPINNGTHIQHTYTLKVSRLLRGKFSSIIAPIL